MVRNAMEVDIKWIKKGIEKIEKHLGELNNSVSKIKGVQINHDARIEDLEGTNKINKKEKWANKQNLVTFLAGLSSGVIVALTSIIIYFI